MRRVSCRTAKDPNKDLQRECVACKGAILDIAWDNDKDSDMILAAGDFQAEKQAVTKMVSCRAWLH